MSGTPAPTHRIGASLGLTSGSPRSVARALKRRMSWVRRLRRGATASDRCKLAEAMMAPSIGGWTGPEKINGPDWYLAGGVPDTFTYHLNATASGPMNVSIVTFEQFAAGIECVDAGRGDANFCLHHSGVVKSFLGVRSVSYDFHLAEGCAGYMAVFTAPSAITVNPDVSVTYNPAPTFTGECS